MADRIELPDDPSDGNVAVIPEKKEVVEDGKTLVQDNVDKLTGSGNCSPACNEKEEEEILDEVADSGNPRFVLKDILEDDILKVMTMGYSRIASEKALYHAKNHEVTFALEWLERHELDSNLDNPVPHLRTSELSKEEAEKKAKEVQAELRSRRIEREKEEKRIEEKTKMEEAKKSRDTRMLLQEHERQLQREAMMKEKEAKKHEENILRMKLIEDYKNRFGEDPPESYFTNEKNVRKRDSSKVSGAVMNVFNRNKDDDGCPLIIALLMTYFTNIKNNQFNEKYTRIRTANKHFITKVAPYPDALVLLEVLGFEKEGEGDSEFFVVKDPYIPSFCEALKYLEMIQRQML